jgi:hypothetical protein
MALRLAIWRSATGTARSWQKCLLAIVLGVCLVSVAAAQEAPPDFSVVRLRPSLSIAEKAPLDACLGEPGKEGVD